MFGAEIQAIEEEAMQDLATLIGTVRHQIGMDLEMVGFQLDDAAALALPCQHDKDDEEFWLNVMGAEERMSEALRSAGREVETDFDDLFRAVHAHLIRKRDQENRLS